MIPAPAPREHRLLVPGLMALLVLALLVGPFAALALGTDWRHFDLAEGDGAAIITSLGLSLVSLAMILVLGTPLAWWLARTRFRAQVLIEALVLLPLLTPPLALGIMLAALYGPQSAIGHFMAALGISLTNSAPAFVLAQVYGAMPYYLVAARAAFEAVPRDYEQISLTLGKTRWQTFWRISLPLARAGVAAGAALAWVRAMGEFGIVLIIAYFPQGIPVKLWVNLQDDGLSAVYPLLWCFFALALPLPLVLGLRSRRVAG
ncbi:MAG: ABC transporter permease subunit [Hyphomicrobiales bacterium]|nr:ABC transporter permease subunit [Hyphomicrobiales bacterium]